jgi:CMP-2-keto-3-deoxyoctulosonic acid synthetase
VGGELATRHASSTKLPTKPLAELVGVAVIHSGSLSRSSDLAAVRGMSGPRDRLIPR